MKIELKRLTEEYKEELMYICNNIDRKYLSNRMPKPYKDSDAEWWLDYVGKNEGKDGLFRIIAVDGKLCGMISIERRGDIYTKEGSLGYCLLTDYWGKGIMTKATEEICKLAFNQLDIIKIMATTFKDNIGSRKVIEKNGFKLEGIREKSIYKDGIVYDEYLYGKLKDNNKAY